MELRFWKMNGAGNDFILLDNRSGAVQLTPALVQRLCDRHRGVGADGVIALRPCASGRADWSWEFYNSDGSCAEMCGNGARCFARFVQRVTGWDRPVLRFETVAGVVEARYEGREVTIRLTPPTDVRLRLVLPLQSGPVELHAINTGVPHAVLFVPDADQAAVGRMGPEIRWHPTFAPRGTNVNFVQILEPGHIRVRTFERGVEGETLACGTGVTASALVTALLYEVPSPIRVRVQGGDTLRVAFRRVGDQFEEVYLTGPAEFVFEGTIQI
ncbi:diaminopimelate epimerase [Limisphaera ngatamarikiensis]|uniref:Diaminopimelate epimerase n=1 Tax=Limisphaera ngatamarikiensis TaxID=1324935 RepID=A0A6M1RW28_9BACT|nr:diaminopimelate epimerase [Limisphaera ngatamarikiensis]NGO39022.1 diaminopimelate epimerase [Limisphaera ngatamarikiensis]